MWTGGTLGAGLSYNDFIYAVLVGNLILGVYTSAFGYIGASTGMSTHLLARYSFGSKGSWIPSLLLGGTQVGWLTFLSAAIPPVGAVIIVDFFTRRARYAQYPRQDFKVLNWAALIAVACGVACGHWLPGIVPLNAVLGSGLAYMLINPLFDK